MLSVRFHFGGEFMYIGPELDYIGGDHAMLEIEIDKVSLPELRGHLADHMDVVEELKLYFLIPGSELKDSLLFLYDDTRTMMMAKHITDGGVAEVFVDSSGANEEDNPSGSDYEEEIGDEQSDEDSEEERGSS